MGKAAAKINGARVNLAIWPSEDHFLCDTERGFHFLYPIQILIKFILGGLTIKTAFKTEDFGLLFLCVPKVVMILILSCKFFKLSRARRRLLKWVVDTWENL